MDVTDSASGTPGTGDEQRTTALPRPGQQTPPPGGQQPPPGGRPPPPGGRPAVPPVPVHPSPADANATTVLSRPAAWPPPASNLPGAARPAAPAGPAAPPLQPYQPPTYPAPPASPARPAGPSGSSGPAGYSGPPDYSGPAGYSGPPAHSGPAGYSGYESPSGYSAPAGRPYERPAADPRGSQERGRPDDYYEGRPPRGYGREPGYPSDRAPSGYRGYDPQPYDQQPYDPRRDYRDERYPADPYRDQRYRDERYPDGRYRDDRHPGDPYRDEPYRDERYRDERYPDGRYRDDRRDPDGWDDGYPADRPPAGQPAAQRRAAAPSTLPPYHEPPALSGGDDAGGAAATAAATASGGAEVAGAAGAPAVPPGTGGRAPRKLTVTRVAALRSKELTHRGVTKFHGAVSADGADRSGLTHLTYAVMANYAVDAALAVALANTLFFAAAKADSTGKVLLYLLLTVAPFAVIAPLIGPLLDRIQTGRRVALSISSFGRALLALTMAIKFDSWVIYPCALGMLVLSKSFGVLKAALTPRVLPEEITLVKTNSRLSVFGMIAGGLSGVLAAGLSWAGGSPAALIFTAVCAVVCGVLCLRIPAWVESTAGEVPVRKRDRDPAQQVFPPAVSATLWTNATIRIETGFLALFIAFVVKSRFQPRSVVAPADGSPPPVPHTDFSQLLLLGVVGAAAGVGGFVGNALGARLTLRNPERVAVISLGAIILSVLVAILVPGLLTAGLVAFVGSTGSSLAKVCLDSVIQRDLPEVNRASAFGRSESVLQLSWVFGGVIGLFTGGVWALSQGMVFVVGFGIIGVLLVLCGAQCVAMSMGKSLLPALHLGSRSSRGSRRGGAPQLATPGVPGSTPGSGVGSGSSGQAGAGSGSGSGSGGGSAGGGRSGAGSGSGSGGGSAGGGRSGAGSGSGGSGRSGGAATPASAPRRTKPRKAGDPR